MFNTPTLQQYSLAYRKAGFCLPGGLTPNKRNTELQLGKATLGQKKLPLPLRSELLLQALVARHVLAAAQKCLGQRLLSANEKWCFAPAEQTSQVN